MFDEAFRRRVQGEGAKLPARMERDVGPGFAIGGEVAGGIDTVEPAVDQHRVASEVGHRQLEETYGGNTVVDQVSVRSADSGRLAHEIRMRSIGM